MGPENLLEDDLKKLYFTDLISEKSYSFTINISKTTIKKKKFKKWLMSKGISRNDADYLCYAVGFNKGKISYNDLYMLRILYPRFSFLDIYNLIWRESN